MQVGASSLGLDMTPVDGGFAWESYNEGPASSSDDGTFTKDSLWEQLSLTWDTSDYLWYMTE